MTDASNNIKADGMDRQRLQYLLKDAEPRRLKMLATTIGLAFSVCIFTASFAPLGGGFIRAIVGVIVAIALWQLGNRLWRDTAIATIAPALGEGWGQKHFVSGWGTVPIEEWLRDLFSVEGRLSTAWRSEGEYRSVQYRLTEQTIRFRRHSKRRQEVIHTVTVAVSVPKPFSGRVEFRPSSGLFGRLEDVLRHVSGDGEQRRAIDAEFDASFDTIASSGASVDALVTPGFRRALLMLAKRHPNTHLTAHFEHGWFHLRLPIPHLAFASAHLLKPLPAMIDDVDELWWDLTIAHRLIDGLMGDHDGPLR